MPALQSKEKFSTQVDVKLLKEFRHLADIEGRKIQSLIEEGMKMVLESHQHQNPREHVMRTYNKSHKKYSGLYKKLAK
jgi:hypothetical protein